MKKLFRSVLLAVTTVVVCFAGASSFAAFQLFDNFDSYTPGNLAGQGPVGSLWNVGQPTYASVITVANTPGPNVAAIGSVVGGPANGVVNAYRSLSPLGLSIPNASTAATFFWQFQISSTATTPSGGTPANNWNFALNDVAAPTGNSGDNEVQFNADLSAASFRARSAANFKVLSYDGTAAGNVPLLANSTYNVWFVINNSADTYKVYIENDSIPSLNGSAHQLFANDASGGTFTFRNSGAGPVANDLTTVNFGSGGTTQTSPVWVDNLFVDLAGENLNVVPEPASITLLVLGGLGFLLAGRRRRA